VRTAEEKKFRSHPRSAPCWLRKQPTQGPFAKLFTKRSGRNKKKSLLRILRSDFWLMRISGLFFATNSGSVMWPRLFCLISRTSDCLECCVFCPLGQYLVPGRTVGRAVV